MSQPNVLLFADTTHPARAVSNHIDAISTSKSINWHIVNPLIFKTFDKFDFRRFDAIGIHYSIKPYSTYYLSNALKEKLKEYSGVKFLFLQDEYQKVNTIQDFLYDYKFDLLFTLVNEHYLPIAYPDPRLQALKKVTVLTAYVADEMKAFTNVPILERSIDVSYRSRPCEYWLGRLAYEKEFIAEQFVKRTQSYNLVLDINLEESSRVYGADWIKMLQNSRAVLATESGASLWDFDGSVQKETSYFLKHNKEATFDEVFQNVLKSYDGNVIYSAISPRIFEAAATRTPMIMFPGYYSGVCKPHVHYIVLEKDFSNLDEVIAKLNDSEYLQALADRTYHDLILSDDYSQHQFSNLVAGEIIHNIQPKEKYTDVGWLASQLENHKQQFKLLNQSRRIITELLFINNKFWEFLTDPKYTVSKRFQLLVKGLKRYAAYLNSRFKKKESSL